MARAIDADELKTNCKITGEFMNNFECVSLATLGEIIDKQPTIDPVKHGKWIGLEYDGYADGYPVWEKWECSECGNEIYKEEPPAYCCDCGARMDGE